MDIDAVAPLHGQTGWLEFRLHGEYVPRLLVKVERRNKRAVPVRVVLDGEMDARTARGIPWGRFEAIASRFDAVATSGTWKRETLTRPDGSDPERFYALVTEAYQEALAASAKPATVLADEAKVPVGTVHRWIREARRQGFLPPARQRRAG